MAAKIAIAAGKRDSPGLRRDSEHPHSAAAMVWCSRVSIPALALVYGSCGVATTIDLACANAVQVE